MLQNCRKAKVILEGRELKEEEREKYKFLPKHIQHIATIVYIGSTRPRNENTINVNLNDAPAIEAWLSKRHLSPANLDNFLNGETGATTGPKWDAKKDKDGFKLPEEPTGNTKKMAKMAKNPFEAKSLLHGPPVPPPGMMGPMMGRGRGFGPPGPGMIFETCDIILINCRHVAYDLRSITHLANNTEFNYARRFWRAHGSGTSWRAHRSRSYGSYGSNGSWFRRVRRVSRP